MNYAALMCIVLGTMIAALRAPLIVAPELTRRIYLEMLETKLRVRLMGVAVTALGVAMIVAGQDPVDFVSVLVLCTGWVLALAGFFGMVVLAFLVQAMMEALLAAMEPIMLRVIGLASVGFGLFYLYLGIMAW